MCFRSDHFENFGDQCGYRGAAKFPALKFDGLDLNDDDVVRQHAKVLGDHQEIIQIDDAGDSLRDARLNLFFRRELLAPLDPINSTRLAPALCSREEHHAIVWGAILQVLHDGDGAITEIVDFDAGIPIERFESGEQIWPDGEIAEVSIADDADKSSQGYSSTPHAQVLTSRVTTLSEPSTYMCVVHGMQGSKLRMVRRMSIPL